jgi:hypothetical protein
LPLNLAELIEKPLGAKNDSTAIVLVVAESAAIAVHESRAGMAAV